MSRPEKPVIVKVVSSAAVKVPSAKVPSEASTPFLAVM